MSQHHLSQLAEHIYWKLHNLKMDMSWELEKEMVKKISELGLHDIATENLAINNPKDRNVHLRSSLSPYIRGVKQTTNITTNNVVSTIDFFDWIVYVWGKIPEGSRIKRQDSFGEWAKELADFDRTSLYNFTMPNKNSIRNGVSSWSKILSFIDHNQFPIYDSLVSVSLNICIMDFNFDQVRFSMPESTSITTKVCKWSIMEEWNKKYVGYHFYISLLDALINLNPKNMSFVKNPEHQLPTDRLEAEMLIFGTSKRIIEDHFAEIKNLMENGDKPNLASKLEKYLKSLEMQKQKRAEMANKNNDI